MCIHLCICAHMETRCRINCLFLSVSTLFLRQFLLLNMELNYLVRLIDQWASVPSYLYFPVLALEICTVLCMGALEGQTQVLRFVPQNFTNWAIPRSPFKHLKKTFYGQNLVKPELSAEIWGLVLDIYRNGSDLDFKIYDCLVICLYFIVMLIKYILMENSSK